MDGEKNIKLGEGVLSVLDVGVQIYVYDPSGDISRVQKYLRDYLTL